MPRAEGRLIQIKRPPPRPSHTARQIYRRTAGVTEPAAPRGRIVSKNDRHEIRIERLFSCAPGQIWERLTKPARLAEWLAPGRIEQRLGGTAKLDFADSGIAIDSTVTALQIPFVLEYSWSSPGQPARPLRFENAIAPGGTRLALTVSIPASEDAPRTAAGFEAHLEMLAAALEGVPIKFPFPLFKELRGAYQATMPSAAA
jgi:uncharacterized protein YndB with AHSA1/START domain